METVLIVIHLVIVVIMAGVILLQRSEGGALGIGGGGGSGGFTSRGSGNVMTRITACLLYTSPSPRDQRGSRMPSSA